MESLEQREKIAAEEHLKDIQGEILLLIRDFGKESFDQKKISIFTQKMTELIKELNRVASSQLINEDFRCSVARSLLKELGDIFSEYGRLGLIKDGLFVSALNFLPKFLGALEFKDDDLFVRYTSNPGKTNRYKKSYWTLVKKEDDGTAYKKGATTAVYARFRDLLDTGMVCLDIIGSGAGSKIEIFHDEEDYSGVIEREEKLT